MSISDQVLVKTGTQLLTLLDDYMQVTSMTANERYLEALEEFRQILTAAANARQGHYTPHLVRYDSPEAGDPYWEFIEADVPSVTGQMQAANVELLYDMADRTRVIGMRVYDGNARKGEGGDGPDGPDGPVEDLAGPAARRLFQYTRTFNAIAAATSRNAVGVGISVRAFIKAFGPIDLDILPASLSPLPVVSSVGVEPFVAEYGKSDGATDYFAALRCDGREMTLFKHTIRGRAEYEVAELNWLINGGEKPNMVDWLDRTADPAALNPTIGG